MNNFRILSEKLLNRKKREMLWGRLFHGEKLDVTDHGDHFVIDGGRREYQKVKNLVSSLGLDNSVSVTISDSIIVRFV